MSKKIKSNVKLSPNDSTAETLKKIKAVEKTVNANMNDPKKSDLVQAHLDLINRELTTFRNFIGALHLVMCFAEGNSNCREFVMRHFGVFPSSVQIACAQVEKDFFNGYARDAVEAVIKEYLFGKVETKETERKPAHKSKPTSKKNKTPNKKRKH